MRSVRRYLLLVAAIYAAGVATYFSAPESHAIRGYFVTEDSLLESLSAATFALAFVAGAIVLARGVRPGFERRWLLLVSALGLLGFLDEMSYGQRLFDWQPAMVDGTAFDAAHDVFDMAYFEAPKVLRPYHAPLVFVVGIGVGTFCAVVLRWRAELHRFVLGARGEPLYALLVLFVLMLATSVTIDLATDSAWPTDLRVVEELSEWNAGIALVFSVFLVRRRATR